MMVKATAPTILPQRPPVGRRRTGAAAALAAALAAAAVGACTTREVADFLHAGGKIAYDSMKARQQSE